MPVPTNSITASSVNGTLVAASLLLDNNSKQARIVLSGTYTGVTGTIDTSMDNATWINQQAKQENSGALVNGTITVSAANLSFLLDCDGWKYIRFNCTACASGTCVQTVYAASSLATSTTPILANTSSQTAFTNGTFTGTLAVTGATTLSSTLAVTGAQTLTGDTTMSGNATVGGTFGATGVATFTAAVNLGGEIAPSTNDGAALGDATHNFSDLFLATGATINVANGNWVATHSSAILTVGTGDLRVTTAGTNTASVVTVGGTQTLAAKTLTTPVIGVATGTSLAVSGLLTSSSASAGIGYATGAGSTVSQGTGRTTGVTINAICGAITLVSAAGSATPATFTVTNSAVAALDTVIVSQKSGTDAYSATVSAVTNGTFKLTITDLTGTTTETPVFNFAVIKAVAS